MTHRRPAAAVPGRRRALPPPLPARAGRRVPGHQPRAVHAGPRPVVRLRGTGRRRRPSCASSATPTSRSTPSAAPTIRNIVEFERDYPDARTILLEQNYRSTQTILTAANARDRPQPGPPRQEPVDRRRRRRDGRRLRRRQRARRGRVRRRRDRPARRRRGRPPRRRGRLLPHQRAVPGLRGRVRPARHAVQGRRRGALLRAPRGPRRAGLPPGASPTPTTSSRLRRILNVPKRGIGDRAEAVVERLRRARAHHLRRRAPPRPTRSRAWRPVRRTPPTSSRMLDELPRGAPRRSAPDTLDAVLDAPATAPNSSTPTTRRTSRGWRTCASSWRGRGSSRSSRRAREAASLEASSSGSRWSPTPTRSPTARRGVVTLMTLHTAKGLEFPVVSSPAWRTACSPTCAPWPTRRSSPRNGGWPTSGSPAPSERLYVSRAVYRSAWGAPQYNPPSRFLDEIPPELLSWEREAPVVPRQEASPFGERRGVSQRYQTRRLR